MSQKIDKAKLERKSSKDLKPQISSTESNKVKTTKIPATLPGKPLATEAKSNVEKTPLATLKIVASEVAAPAGSKQTPRRETRQKGGEIVIVERNQKSFKVLYAITILVGLLMVAAMAFWICNYLDGVDLGIRFNWHPLLMTIGFIFLYGMAILVYRGFRKATKKNLKIVHAILHVIVLITALFALVPVFKDSDTHLFSMHSWIGIFAIVLFVFQFLAGFMAYMLPFFKDYYKMAYMPVHIYFGSLTFVLGICASLTGLAEKALYEYGYNYSKLENSALMANACGCLIVVFGALVLYLSTFPLYKRKPLTLDYFSDIVNNYLEDKFRR